MSRVRGFEGKIKEQKVSALGAALDHERPSSLVRLNLEDDRKLDQQPYTLLLPHFEAAGWLEDMQGEKGGGTITRRTEASV